jgi:ubiquinone/menaquinone biosynthesis C-methylase UbiE
MNDRKPGPGEGNLSQRYAKWRNSTLGSITERLEIAAVFDLLGPIEGKRLLDAGCGDGVYSIEAARRGARVTGLDLSEGMLNEARKRSLAAGVTVDWKRGDVLRLPYPNDSFDIVTAITLLCLVPGPGAAVAEMARVLAPGGRVVIGDLHRWSLVAAKRRLRGWSGNAFWRDAHFWTAKELLALLSHAGLKAGRKRGTAYFPPSGIAARVLSPLEPLFSKLGTFGAAFLVVEGLNPPALQ